MKRGLIVLAALLIVAVASLQSALATTEKKAAPTETGITKTSIALGGTFPLSGAVASLYGPIPRGMEAYFKYINARKAKSDGKRGIYGRQIVWKYYDDEYNPAKTVQFTNQLLLQDKVYALVGSLGTEHNQAIRPLTNQRKVPHILVSTGASYWGLQYKDFPWTTGWQPDYIAEGRTYGEWIKKNAPRAKIAVFSQNDDYGKDYLRGLKIGLGASRSLIVSEQTYETTDASYGSQITRQKASGADTWVLLTTPTPTVRAIGTAKALNWKPDTIVINSVAAVDSVMRAATSSAGAEFTNGAISTAYLKNPNNPKYTNDPSVKLYRSIMQRYGPSGADVNNTFFYYGVAKAYDTMRLLYLAGKNPTRASLIRATQKMNWVNPFTIKGIKVKTGSRDRFPIAQFKLIRYNNGSWNEFGSLIKGR